MAVRTPRVLATAVSAPQELDLPPEAPAGGAVEQVRRSAIHPSRPRSRSSDSDAGRHISSQGRLSRRHNVFNRLMSGTDLSGKKFSSAGRTSRVHSLERLEKRFRGWTASKNVSWMTSAAKSGDRSRKSGYR